MKTSKALKIVISLLLGVLIIHSCREKAPDIDRKEQDARLLGVWVQVDNPIYRAEFRCNGVFIGLDLPEGKKIFYTEKDSHLVVFVYGHKLKPLHWTYKYSYKINGDKLYLWSSKEETLEEIPASAQVYTKSK